MLNLLFLKVNAQRVISYFFQQEAEKCTIHFHCDRLTAGSHPTPGL